MVKFLMKFFLVSTFSFSFAQIPFHIESDRVGKGISLNSKGKIYILTPEHVVRDSKLRIKLRDHNRQEYIGSIVETFQNDLALLDLNHQSLGNYPQWSMASNVDGLLANVDAGFLEVIQSTGDIKIIKMAVTARDKNYLVARPFFSDNKIIKGMSGSAFYQNINGKKVFLGMLMKVTTSGQGVILRADILKNILGDYLQSGNENKSKAKINEFLMPKFDNHYCSYYNNILHNDNVASIITPNSVGERGHVAFITDTLRKTKLSYSMSLDNKSSDIENKTNVFNPGDAIRLFIAHHKSIKFDEFSFDIFFYDAAGNLYYQRAIPERTAKNCLYHKFSVVQSVDNPDLIGN